MAILSPQQITKIESTELLMYIEDTIRGVERLINCASRTRKSNSILVKSIEFKNQMLAVQEALAKDITVDQLSWLERHLYKLDVAGSNPASTTITKVNN